ncbi:2-oxo acid dehydrogenase subunit E2 [bacterium]|nr:2-oxo acid dehydrogenase subunit E2 [bacterium]
MKIPFGIGNADTGTAAGTDDIKNGEITFHAAHGAGVKKGDIIATFEMEKTSVDIAAPVAGMIELSFKNGDRWDREGVLESSSGIILAPPFGFIETEKPEVPEERKKDEKGESAEAEAEANPEPTLPQKTADSPREEISGIPIIPAAREIMRTKGIETEGITPSGPRGEILVRDVVSGEISAKKESLAYTKTSVPHIRLKPSVEWLAVAKNLIGIVAGGTMEFNIKPLLTLRNDIGAAYKERYGVEIRPWAILAHAAVQIVREENFRVLNGAWITNRAAGSDEIILYETVNLGFSYDRGENILIDRAKGTISGPRLRILTLHGAEREIDPKAFFAAASSLIARADVGKSTHQDLKDWTFVVNNLGALRHESGVSILTKEISGMMNIGYARDDGNIKLQLFFDHRLCDGTMVTKFLTRVTEKAIQETAPAIRACLGQ